VRRLIADAEEIPVGLALKYLLQGLHALRAAHSQGVSHRGLKPENLLIDAHGNIKVSDFGFARIVERDQAVIRQVYVGMGAVAYMAPELFTDPLGAGPQSDIYALGILFYELLTRKLPGRRSPMPSAVNPTLPKGLDDVWDRMTRDERVERYTSVEEILQDCAKLDGLEKIVDGGGAILWGENPIAKLKFRSPPTPVPVPVTPSTKVVADDTTAPSAPTTPAAEGEARDDETKNRPVRRPYSFQQRQKDKPEG
jgi:serine/threonine protein kinase